MSAMADLTIQEACQRLGCSERTFYHLRKKNAFPHLYKQSGRVFIPEADIDRYLTDRVSPALADTGRSASAPSPAAPQVAGDPMTDRAVPEAEGLSPAPVRTKTALSLFLRWLRKLNQIVVIGSQEMDVAFMKIIDFLELDSDE